jgi:hypothetical protein
MSMPPADPFVEAPEVRDTVPLEEEPEDSPEERERSPVPLAAEADCMETDPLPAAWPKPDEIMTFPPLFDCDIPAEISKSVPAPVCVPPIAILIAPADFSASPLDSVTSPERSPLPVVREMSPEVPSTAATALIATDPLDLPAPLAKDKEPPVEECESPAVTATPAPSPTVLRPART